MKLNKKDKNEFGADWLKSNLFKNASTIEKEINKYITLKLVGGRTYIYVNGKRFIQCIRLILNIPKSDVHLYDEIDSIDEAAKLYSNHVFQNRIVRGPMAARVPNQTHDITPEQEFWGHCSNIQAWVEHDYDTRILMSNIAFPLLRELTRAGDPLASKVFKEEIALRLESGYPSVVQYLLNQGFIRYFTADEFKSIIESTEIINGLSSSPKMLARFLIACGSRFPTVVEAIITQVFKLPEGKNIIISSMNISERSHIMPFLRTSFRPRSQYLLTLKIALDNLFIEADDKLGEDIIDCIHEIESKLEGMTFDALSIRAMENLNVFEEFYLENMVLGNLKNKEHLPLAEKFLGELHKFRSKCPYCGKEIPRGQNTCAWCGHRKDDKGGSGFYPYPYIFKPPGGGGSMKGTIAVAVKSKT